MHQWTDEELVGNKVPMPDVIRQAAEMKLVEKRPA